MFWLEYTVGGVKKKKKKGFFSSRPKARVFCGVFVRGGEHIVPKAPPHKNFLLPPPPTLQKPVPFQKNPGGGYKRNPPRFSMQNFMENRFNPC